ncbi:MAG TPA: hypothetical protein VNO21_19255, partial [Polyangiaceae bacterium]|nr:hypothetical protein [Polyangiaceae bacterium]
MDRSCQGIQFFSLCAVALVAASCDKPSSSSSVGSSAVAVAPEDAGKVGAGAVDAAPLIESRLRQGRRPPVESRLRQSPRPPVESRLRQSRRPPDASLPPKARVVPPRVLPLPDTVSPELRAIIAATVRSSEPVPKDVAEWKKYVADLAALEMKELPEMRERLGVTVTPSTLGGVPVFVVTPKVIAPRNRHRVLLHFHAGGYVRMPGEAGTQEAVELAGFGGFQVISVDYRM